MSETRTGPLVGKLVSAVQDVVSGFKDVVTAFGGVATSLLAVLASNAERLARLAFLKVVPPPRHRNGNERRKNPRQCPLCGGPMRSDEREARVERGRDGTIRNVPPDVLAWFRCARCHRAQVGVPRAS